MKNTFTAKLPGQRKTREWSVLPVEGGERIVVQADGVIGIFAWRTGEGKLCTRGGYFPHLAIAKPYAFPADFVQACLRVCPSLGGETVIGGGVAIVEHSIRVAAEPGACRVPPEQ